MLARKLLALTSPAVRLRARIIKRPRGRVAHFYQGFECLKA